MVVFLGFFHGLYMEKALTGHDNGVIPVFGVFTFNITELPHGIAPTELSNFTLKDRDLRPATPINAYIIRNKHTVSS